MDDKLRICFVKGKKAYFHCWEDKSKIIEPSVLVGGHGGGVIRTTLGIIEYLEDGSVRECYPNEIVFEPKE